MFDSVRSGWSTHKKLMFLKAAAAVPAVEDTATGNPVVFVTDLAKPLKQLKVNFTPKQASGTPSPENVLPITGWTGVNVGKNTANAVTVTWDAEGDGKYIAQKGGVVESANYHYSNLLPVSVGDYVYIFSVTGTQTSRNTRVHGYNSSGEWVKQLTFQSTQNGVFVLPFTVDSDIAYIRVSNIKVATDDIICVPETYPVTWQTHGTIYGGYVDLVTGEVWATWYKYSTTWGDMDFGAEIGDYTRKTYSISRQDKKLKNGAENSVCSVTNVYLNANSTETTHYYISSTGWTFYLILPTATDSETPVEFAGVMYEPVLITTLTPQQINAIKNQTNTVWSDGNGDCSVTFVKKG